MTQQPGKGSEYRQNQAQNPTSFKDSLHDASKHRQRAPLAEAEKTEVLYYESVKEAKERIEPDQKAGNVGAHQRFLSDESTILDVGDTDLNERSASSAEGLGYESVKDAEEGIPLDQKADNSGEHKRRSSDENTFLGEGDVDLKSANMTESNPNETATNKESNQEQSETKQREQSVRTHDFDAADGQNAFQTQPSIPKDNTTDQCSSRGKDIAAEDKADYVTNGALQIQHDCQTTGGQLNKSVGEQDIEPDKYTDTSTRENATGTVTDDSKNMAAEHLNSGISVDKELHDAQETEFESPKLERDIEVATEKNKSTGGETLDVCSPDTENETHEMADVTSTELAKNDSEEANMNSDVIISEKLPLIRCLKLMTKVMERYPKVKVCEDPDQIKFTSVSVEDAVAARKEIDVLISSLNYQTVTLRHPIAMLLSHAEVKAFLHQRMVKEGVQCFWVVTSDGCLKLYGLKTEMIQRAQKIIKESICIKEDVELAFASELILKFSGKCQKWVAAEGETKGTIVYTKDIEEDIIKMVANMTEEKRQSDFTNTPDQIISVQTNLKAPEGLEHSKTLSENAGMNPHVETMQKREELRNTLSEETYSETKTVRKQQGSDDFEHFSIVPLEVCMIRYLKSQEEIQRIKSKFSVEINYETDYVLINGNTDIDVSGAAKALKDLAKSVQMDFRFKMDSVQENSEEWRALQTKAQKNNASVYVENISCRSLPDKVSFHVGNTEVKLYCGLITDIVKVDIVVCPVNDCLLPTAPMSELIFKTGGETLYSASTAAASKFVFSNKSRHPPLGYIQFINEVGNLPCSLLACIVVDDNSETLERKVTSTLTHILDKASENGLHSVAIPLEVSKLSPVQLTNACVEALKIAAAKPVAIPMVYLCGLITENVKLAAKILETEVKQGADGSCKMVDVYSYDPGVLSSKVKLELAVGSLLDQKVDTVVCVVHKSFKLERGKVGELILKQGGEQIQTELRQQSQRSQAGKADVVATNGGKLAFKCILFGSLPKMGNENKDYVIQNIKLFLRNCFLCAKQHGCVSIAFPVFGTGGLGYELEMVSREMFRAVHLYAAANNVTEVRFVLMPEDETGQKVFAKMNKTFQQLQESIDAREDCCPYYEVKISNLGTKVIVVKNKDYEALAADVIAESVESEHDLQGGRNYLIKPKETEDESCLSDHYTLQFHVASTLSDFQDCLKFFLWRYIRKNSIVSLDFTKGLDGTGHYIRGAIELLKTHEETIKNIRQITIVSTDRSFTEVQNSESGTEMENKTWGLSSLWPSFLKQHKVAWYLKHFISTKQREPKYRCLVVVHSRDIDTLKQIILDIDHLFKKTSGSFEDGDNVECTRKPLPPTTSTFKSKIYAGSESTGSSLDLKSHAMDKEDTDSAESSTSTAVGGPIETDSDDEFEDEVFGSVHAVLSPDITLPAEKLAYELKEIGNAKISVNSVESKTLLNFKFSERYQVLEMMLKMNTSGLLYVKRKEVIAKSDISGSGVPIYKVEDVDDNLYDLLLLYIRENHAHTSVKEEHLQREGTTVFVLTEEPFFDVVKTKLKALRGWNTETVCFEEDKRAEAIQAVNKLKDEDQNIIVKLIGKEIRIHGPSEKTAPAKHKVNIALGVIKTTGRRRRQFNEGFSSLQTEILPEDQVKNTSATKLSTRQYRTDEGIAVHVYKGDITSLKVDCIVNAANEHLNHGGGVARAISEAAGPEFQNESSRYVIAYGQIPVTQCVETSPGDLRYKYVIHAVGPRFSHDADTSKCVADLETTVFNALKRADALNLVSVALPSISAGIFGGQIDACADAYVRGVRRFSKQASRFVLKEIHFVDIQEEFVRKIQSVFDAVFQLTQSPFAVSMRTNNISETDKNLEDTPFQSSATKHEKDMGQSLKSEEDPWMIHEKGKRGLQETQNTSTSYSNKPLASMQPEIESQTEKAPASNLYPKLDTNWTNMPLSVGRGMQYTASRQDTNASVSLAATQLSDSVKDKGSTDLTEYISDKGIKIFVCKGDISMLSVDAVVCPEHTNCLGVDSIARSIKSVVGNDSVWVEAKRLHPEPLSILRMPTKIEAPYKYVILVFSPRWHCGVHPMKTRNQTQNQETYWTSVRKIILRTLEDSEQATIRSISFPLIGVGDGTTPYQLCCDVLCDEVTNYANDKNKTSRLKEIYIVSKEERVHFMCKEALGKRFDTAATDMKLGSKHKNSVPVRSKVKTCSVCHTIGCDASNKILGMKHTGTERHTNHPFCTMRCKTMSSLPGYAKCDTISIDYEIPAGKQREDDPQPGQTYYYSRFYAYLPASEEGWIVLKLFQKAVEKGRVFKVGRNGFVGWSGLVEHKTMYSFPDINYLSRVRQQLAGLGIWPDKPKTRSGTLV